MKTSDEALAKAAAAGDRDAFSALLERRYDGLFRLAFRLTGNRADAEDLTQDICTTLPKKLAAFRGDSRFSTWLYRVAVNASHDRSRRLKARGLMASKWGDWETNRMATNAETSENIDWLVQAMSSLNTDLRDTMALILDEELTHAEAAYILGVSDGTVSWRVSEVKKHLRAIAQEQFDR